MAKLAKEMSALEVGRLSSEGTYVDFHVNLTPLD